MAYNKGLHSSSGGSHRGRPYVLILLITFGAALLGVMVLHKLRERRIYNLLVKEKDHQLHALQLLLQKERDRSKELRGKNEEMKGKIYTLRSQKMELARSVVEMQSTLDSLKDEQKVMESAFEEKQNELRLLEEKGSNGGQGDSEILALRENLKHKEAEIKDLKRRLEIPVKNNQESINNDHPTIFPGIVTANETMVAQDRTENENKEDESSSESAKHEGDDKRVMNEDARKSKLTKFKDGEVAAEIKDEIGTDEELGKTNEDAQDDSDGAGVAIKDIVAEVVDGREKKTNREEEVAQLENNTDGPGHDIDVKQLTGSKGKHGHASRTKGKRGKIIVKNKLMENNGIFESNGGVYMGNRRVYRDEKDEFKDRRLGKVSTLKKFARKESKDDNPRKDNPPAKLLKLETHENREDANNITGNNTTHQETNNGINIYPEKQSRNEKRRSEEHEDSLVQQNWSTRHIKKADKNAQQTKSNSSDKNTDQTNSNMLREEHEELEVLDVQKQEKDAIDDGDEEHDNDDFKESQSEFEDEKEEYKEETDESEFRSAL
ncbi:hypothetical protein VNO77_36897 [Canavalia gladiata]|uniref:Uncharacterized protein n=1 Tax=Canavalia gladiata TaxID=3824 RepID=A0AAN9K7P1_CANGL